LFGGASHVGLSEWCVAILVSGLALLGNSATAKDGSSMRRPR
jgi:hypothetical protein